MRLVLRLLGVDVLEIETGPPSYDDEPDQAPVEPPAQLFHFGEAPLDDRVLHHTE